MRPAPSESARSRLLPASPFKTPPRALALRELEHDGGGELRRARRSLPSSRREASQIFGDEVSEQPGGPEIMRDPTPRPVESAPFEMLPEPANVALQERLSVAILLRVHRLGEVDQGDLAVPDEDVVAGEVPVHDVAVQHAFDRAVELLPQRSELILIVVPVLVQPRRRDVLVADVRHQDGVVGALDRPGYRNAAIQLLEGFPFSAHPERALELAPVAGLLLEGDAHASLLDELAVSVQRLVAEVSTIQRVIELQGDELLARRPRVRAEQMDARFLAVLERFEMGFDESFVEEMLERFVSQRVLLLIGMRTCGTAIPWSASRS